MPEQVRSTMDGVTTRGTFAGCLAYSPDGRLLATGHPNSTILLWDLPLPPSPPQTFTAPELNRLWTALAGADAPAGWRAIWRLAEAPSDALPFLRARLKPVAPAPLDQVRQQIRALDDDAFQRRQEAVNRLKAWGVLAAPAVREALRGEVTIDKKRLLDDVLAAAESPQPLDHESLRQIRAVTVLERIDSPEARQILTKLAQGVDLAPLTRSARGALQRLH
jgi:hypothetical protein